MRLLGAIVVWPGDGQGTVYRLDVTNYVRWAAGLDAVFSCFAPRDADGTLTFVMVNIFVYSAVSNDASEFRSRETALECEAPHLEVYP